MSKTLSPSERQQLLELAASSLSCGLSSGRALSIDVHQYSERLRQHRASFVTLNRDQRLRGCIGSLTAHRPLVQDIVENAYAAAFQDPRFNPISEQELPLLHYHISILSPASTLSFCSEQDLIKQIRPGIDGLILTESFYRSTFLPSVWQQLPDKQLFLAHLKQKAGLPADYWSDSIGFSRYTVESFSSASL